MKYTKQIMTSVSNNSNEEFSESKYTEGKQGKLQYQPIKDKNKKMCLIRLQVINFEKSRKDNDPWQAI